MAPFRGRHAGSRHHSTLERWSLDIVEDQSRSPVILDRRRGNPDVDLAHALELCRAAQKAGDEVAAGRASLTVAWTCFQLGSVEAGIAHALPARRFFAEAGLKGLGIQATATYAWLLLEVGMTEEAMVTAQLPRIRGERA